MRNRLLLWIALVAVMPVPANAVATTGPIAINFDAAVPGPAAPFLSSFGVTVSNLTGGSQLQIGSCNSACGPNANVLFETNPSLGTVSYELDFSPTLSELQFSRVAVSSGSPIEPAWTAQIYAGDTLLDTVGEGFTFLPRGSPAANFDIKGSGITKMVVTSNNGHFAAFVSVLLANFIITPEGCQVNLSPIQSQSNPKWNRPYYPANYVTLGGLMNPWGTSAFSAFHAYDFSFDCPNSNGNRAVCTSTTFRDIDTLHSKGCALTSLEMALANKDVADVPFRVPLIPPTLSEIDMPLDPGAMNLWMTGNGGFTTRGKVKWDVVTRGLGANMSLTFDTSSWNSADPTVLANQVCQGDKGQPAPVVVGVKINNVEIPAGSGNFVPVPGHFVLVTGATHNPDGTTTFSIADPAGVGQTLDDYANNFLIRGLVSDPSDRSGLDIYTDDEVEMLVTDPLGRRTGFNPSTTIDLREVPSAAYLRDSLTDDQTGELDGRVARSIQIFQPSPGSYRISVAGLRAGLYTIEIDAFASDGSAVQPLTVSGVSGSGSTGFFDVGFAATPGAPSDITRFATFQSALDDIENSLQLGLIDNKGIANSLAEKLLAAQDAAGPERSNILNAFKSEVNAQSGKHITGVALQILIENADSLISQSAQ